MRALQLWAFSGKTGRENYFFIGVIAFLLKSNLDRVIASYFFHRSWGPLNYWFPLPTETRPWPLAAGNARLCATLLAFSLPFIWLGLAQTVRRLRECELPLWLSVLFFVPFANLVFFGALCLWPPARHKRVPKRWGSTSRGCRNPSLKNGGSGFGDRFYSWYRCCSCGSWSTIPGQLWMGTICRRARRSGTALHSDL